MLLCVNREWDFMLQDFQDTIVRIYIDREERPPSRVRWVSCTARDSTTSIRHGDRRLWENRLLAVGSTTLTDPFQRHLRVTIETV